jgi:protease-4
MKTSTAFVAVFVAVMAWLLLGLSAPARAQSSRPDALEVIQIVGEIDSGTAAYVAARVEEISDNPRAKAVLLVVDSPGGGVLATAAIYNELARLKVPVVGWCDSLCASGGMYVLMAPSVKHVGIRTDVTITGSIGVISQGFRVHRLLEHFRVDFETYKSGPRKDEGNPTRAADEQERKNMQGEVDALATKFYRIVEKSRGARVKDWQDVKSARVYFGEEGIAAGLVDQVMSRDEAIAKAKQLSGSKNILTKDELKKISKHAQGSEYHLPSPPPMLRSLSYLLALVETTLREMREGGSTRVEYRMLRQF